VSDSTEIPKIAGPPCITYLCAEYAMLYLKLELGLKEVNFSHIWPSGYILKNNVCHIECLKQTNLSMAFILHLPGVH
jgi:hypothetical protein